jgi:hydroxymethylbilane synthase
VIACTPEREDPRDALVGRSSASLPDLPAGTRLGTGSLRRAALARRLNPGLEIVPIRGNVPTRVRKVEAGEVDVALLAAAGLRRLGLADRIAQLLDVESFCPAPCQGILAVQCRAEEDRTQQLAAALSDPATVVQATAERAFLRRLDADCTVPLGCHAELSPGGSLELRGLVVHPTGRPCFVANTHGDPQHADRLGVELAEALLRLGAEEVVDPG